MECLSYETPSFSPLWDHMSYTAPFISQHKFEQQSGNNTGSKAHLLVDELGNCSGDVTTQRELSARHDKGDELTCEDTAIRTDLNKERSMQLTEGENQFNFSSSLKYFKK